MKLINFTAPRPQFSDVNGDPLALGRVTFYSAGTTTLKTVYSDADKTAAAPNPQPLDSGGFVQDGGVWLDEGRYKVLIEKSDGAGGWVEEYTVDDVPGTPGVPGELTGATIGTIADLRLLDPGAFGAVFVTGYYEGADRGEGWFLWDANNSTADNGGTIISPNGAPAFGRWKRLLQQSKIIPQIFGAMTNTSFGVASNMQSMIDWCNAAGNEEYLKVRLDPGNYFIDGNVDFDNNIDLEVADGVIFDNHPATSGTLTITCQSAIIETKIDSIVGNDISLVFNPTDVSINLNPAWYGFPNFAKLVSIALNLGVRDIDVYTTLEIEPTASGTLQFNNMYFYNGAVFNILSTNVAVNIGEIRSENRVGTSGVNFPIFVAEFANVRIGSGDIFVSWFEFSTAAKFEDLLECITAANTVPRVLKWDIEKTLPGGNSTNYNVNHDFTYGGSVSCTSNVIRFNSITAGNIQIFDIISGGKYEILSGVIFPEWFGAFPYDGTKAASNVTAFNFMFQNWLASPLCYIDGHGASYFLNGSVSVTTNFPFKMKNIKLSESTLVAGTFFDIDGPAEFQNVDFDSNAPTVLKTTTNAAHDVSFENCTFTSDATRGIIDVKGPNTGQATVQKRADFLKCRFESVTVECGDAFITNSFFLYSNVIQERNNQSGGNISDIGLKFLNNTLQSIDGRLATIEIKGMQPGNIAIVTGVYILNNNWVDKAGEVTAAYDTIFATNITNLGHDADVYDNYQHVIGFAKIPTTRPFGRREISSAGTAFTLTLDADETFLAAGEAPLFGYVCGAGNWTGLTSSYYSGNMSFEGAYSIFRNTFPDVWCYWDPPGVPFGNDLVVNYQFINSTNKKIP